MDKPQSNLDVRFMSLRFNVRDLFFPRKNILKEAGIKPGFHVLDHGCGPGSYIIPIAKFVVKSGKIHALDIHPLAIQKVQKIASENKLTNVKTIHSDCKTGLQDNSIDVALLYDTFHDLSDPNGALEELYRISEPNGIQSFSDHHVKEGEIISKVTNRGLFRLSRKGKRTYSFSKEE